MKIWSAFPLALAAILACVACEPATLTVGDPELAQQTPAPEDDPEPNLPPKPDELPPPPGGEAEPPPEQPANADPAEMTITDPPRGARILGDRVRVQGTLTGGVNPQITIGGMPATLRGDGTFYVDVPVTDGIAILVSRMEDGANTSEDHRAVIVNGDVEPTSEIDDAVSMLISRDGFGVITQLISQYASNLDLREIAGAAGGDVEITEVRFDRMDLSLQPTNGALDLNMKVWGLHLAIRTEVDIVFGIDVTVRGHMNADPTISAQLNVAADGAGSMSLSIVNANVQMDNFSYNIRNVPGAVERWFEDRVIRIAEDTLKDALNGVVVPSLFDPDALNQELDLLGKPIDLDLAVQTVNVDPDGMRVGLNSTAVAQDIVNFGKAVRQLGGPNGEVPDAQIDIGLATDFINRMLHAVWASGALNIYIGGPNDSGLDVDLPFNIGILAGPLGEAADGVDRQGKLTIAMRALLPPVCYVDDSDKPLRIVIGDMLVDLGEEEAGTLVTLAVHLDIRVGLKENAEGVIEPDIELTHHVDVAEEPRGKVNKAPLEGLIGTIMNGLPNLIAGNVEMDGADPSEAAPIALENMRFLAIGAFLHILADINPEPPAPAP